MPPVTRPTALARTGFETLPRRPSIGLIAIPGLVLTAVATALLLTATADDAPAAVSTFGQVAVSVALGVFAVLGVLVTALTIVLSLVVSVRSQWPSFADLIRHAALYVWFVVAFAAVALAVVGVVVTNIPVLSLSVALSLVGALLGTWASHRILSVSHGQGRHIFLTKLLGTALRRHDNLTSIDDAVPYDLAPYLAEVDAAVDGNSIDSLRARVEELDDAVAELPPDRLLFSIYQIIRLVQRTGRATLLEVVDTEVARAYAPARHRGEPRDTEADESRPDPRGACEQLHRTARTDAGVAAERG